MQEYLEFEIENEERFHLLKNIFLKIKREKETYFKTNIEPSDKLEDWNHYLDENAIQYFNKRELILDSEEQKIYNKLWHLTDPQIRIHHPMFNTNDNWSFDGTISTIFEGEYDLISIEKHYNKGKLTIEQHGIPFGGTESLVQLIEAFGNKVTHDSWHEGPHIRPEISWNFELAKKLVKNGKGVEQLLKKHRKKSTIKIEKEWFDYEFGYVNIDTKNIYLTNTGNWHETRKLDEKSIYTSRKKNKKTGFSFILILFAVFLLITYFFKEGNLILNGSIFLGLISLIYVIDITFKKEYGEQFKIPFEKIKAIHLYEKHANIFFNDKMNNPSSILITEIDSKGIMILKNLKEQLGMIYYKD
ncbi:hypothetical protein [Aureivirga marina]|uniref:hypothetical protein n=1 Tax=Aureivirga marina TaxID=1182451 RepID=UPI0018CBBA83|nr:hypothetical protein [Aureivirga marina]